MEPLEEPEELLERPLLLEVLVPEFERELEFELRVLVLPELEPDRPLLLEPDELLLELGRLTLLLLELGRVVVPLLLLELLVLGRVVGPLPLVVPGLLPLLLPEPPLLMLPGV